MTRRFIGVLNLLRPMSWRLWHTGVNQFVITHGATSIRLRTKSGRLDDASRRRLRRYPYSFDILERMLWSFEEPVAKPARKRKQRRRSHR